MLPLYGPYAASKYAFEALSDALRRELRGAVHVSIVEPGAIATPIWERGGATADALFAAMPPDAHERYGELVDDDARGGHEAARRGPPARGGRERDRQGADARSAHARAT